MVSGYRAFLGIPGARRLLVSAVVTRVPNGMLSLAILLLIRGRTGSFAIAGIAVGAFALANARGGTGSGGVGGRLGQPLVLGFCSGGQSVLLVLLVLAARARLPPVLLVGLVGLAGALVPPSMACARALWPQIAPDSRTLDAAYTMDAITLEAAVVLGPLLVVAAVALVSPAAAVLLCAAITLAGTAAFISSPLCRHWRSIGTRESRAGALASRDLRRLLASVLLFGFWWGSLLVGLPALAVHARSRDASGVLLALVSVGGVIGGLLYGARAWRSRRTRTAPPGLLAVLLAPLILARTIATAVPFCVLAGLAMTPMLSCQNTLVGAVAPVGTTTEAFTWTTAHLRRDRRGVGGRRITHRACRRRRTIRGRLRRDRTRLSAGSTCPATPPPQRSTRTARLPPRLSLRLHDRTVRSILPRPGRRTRVTPDRPHYWPTTRITPPGGCPTAARGRRRSISRTRGYAPLTKPTWSGLDSRSAARVER